ncbi:MAG: DNA repair protein RadC [Alistipes sp.]|nr:DNA repair protein RadC [Alistipes sp.]
MDFIYNKIATRGIGSLTDAELLAVLLEDANSSVPAVTLAERVLAECGSAANMSRMETARLRMVEGVGLKRAQRIAAAAELGRRFMTAEADTVNAISTSKDVARIFRPLFDGLKYEECWALYLTNSNRIIERQRLSQGGVQGTVVDRRLIAKRALELLATQVIMVHNHPSGEAEPSIQDKELTHNVAEALALFDIRLLDHIIIADKHEFSFRQAGLLR